jgi:ABC-type antimicrobial peptide transport system permease subunit
MFTIIGILIGTFVGYLISEYLDVLAPLRQAARGGIQTGRTMLDNLTSSFGQGPLISIGIVVLVVLLLLWIIDFSTALVLGLILGLIYADEVGGLPFVASTGDLIKQKIKGLKKPDSTS